MSKGKDFAIINPCTLCQPMGAVYALLGVKGAMPIIHGSQGCSTYIRFQLCRHFREPVNIASTSMHESAAIYSGEENLIKALENVISRYNPELIGVTTSCLTETIGDDVNWIVGRFKDAVCNDNDKDNDKDNDNTGTAIIPIKTPSYAGTHLEGYDTTITELIRHLARKSTPVEKLNIIPGILSPADVLEVKRLLCELNCESLMLTDVSESLDSPLTGAISFLPQEGISIAELAESANALGTIALCRHASSGAFFLEEKYGVPAIIGPIPIGIQNTDAFLADVNRLTGCEISVSIQKERGRLIDAMVDAQEYNAGRKVAICGDPDMVTGMTRFVCELGMKPAVVCSSAGSGELMDEISITGRTGRDAECSPAVITGRDLDDLHQYIQNKRVDLLIGNSYVERIAKAEGIPLVRVGFPIYDRIGAQRILILGYRGALHLVDVITNTILEYEEGVFE